MRSHHSTQHSRPLHLYSHGYQSCRSSITFPTSPTMISSDRSFNLSKGARLLMRIRKAQKSPPGGNTPPRHHSTVVSFKVGPLPMQASAQGERAASANPQHTKSPQVQKALNASSQSLRTSRDRSKTLHSSSLAKRGKPYNTKLAKSFGKNKKRKLQGPASSTNGASGAVASPIKTVYKLSERVQRLGLAQQKYKRPTLVKYDKALKNYLMHYPESTLTVQDADLHISDYINMRFEDDPRPGQCQEMANLLSMLTLSHPHLRDHLTLSRRAVQGWKVSKPSKSSMPLTRTMMLAFAKYFLCRAEVGMAVALGVGWAAYLRISEVMRLRWSDIALPGDFRLNDVSGHVCGINIKVAKTGTNQFVLISDEHITTLLQQYHASQADADSKLSRFKTKRYQLFLNDACFFYGLGNLQVTPHSCRIGGVRRALLFERRVGRKHCDQGTLEFSGLHSPLYYECQRMAHGDRSFSQVQPAHQI